MTVDLVLVLNCGSSSVKFSVIAPKSSERLAYGLVERIGIGDADIHWSLKRADSSKKLGVVSYDQAIAEIVNVLRNGNGLYNRITAVGHRVVHGGEAFSKSVMITPEVIKQIESCKPLAPLHNFANIVGIEAAQKVFPQLPHIAVFDTAFHQSMPDFAFVYPIPYKFYEQNDVRRYGFHGTSHRFVTCEAARRLGKPLQESAFVSVHLGNGCSAAAVLEGKSVDTTMGLTPLEGLMMGTRSGDVDPGMHEYLANILTCDIHEITRLLNHDSGLLGVSGVSSDMRAIHEAIAQGNRQAELALSIFCYRLAKYIAALSIPLGRLDALIFTGGIGENDSEVRARVVRWLKIFGFVLDETRNKDHGAENRGIITANQSPIAMVVDTNEELMIAQDVLMLMEGV